MDYDIEKLLEDCGIVEPEADAEDTDICCDIKMIYTGTSYYCSVCFNLKENKNYDNGPSFSSMVKKGSKLHQIYSYSAKTIDSRKADMVAEFRQKLLNQNFILPQDLVELTCDRLLKITDKNIKKASNRVYLSAELLRLASIDTENILTDKEVAKILGLLDTKLSRGSKFVISAILARKVSIDLCKPIHHLYIKKYLNLFDINHFERINTAKTADLSVRSVNTHITTPSESDSVDLAKSAIEVVKDINTPANRSYCINLVELMLDQNIAYNTTIQSKCIAAVYYLIETFYCKISSVKERKKYFKTLVDVGESTFIKIYNTLISEDVYEVIVESPKFRRSYED